MNQEILNRRVGLVNTFLDSYLDSWAETPVRLRQAMLYSLSAGGKRLRPILCLTTASLYGLKEERALEFAAGLELIHTYSLIHDDLPAMDNDDIRRGRPSNHKQFDEATAILAGDGLLTDAFALMARAPIPAPTLLAAIGEVARNAGSPGMVGGQMLDMEYTGHSGIGLDEVSTMQRMKTGAMLEAACVSGAILAEAPESAIAKIRIYGSALGKAFQIADDILDLTSTTEALGKPVGSDSAQGKNTYPALLGLAESRRVAQYEARRAAEAIEADHPDAQFLRDLAYFSVSRTA